MVDVPTYKVGADLPDLTFLWRNRVGALIDFSSGHTFNLKVSKTRGGAALFDKTAGIAGAAGDLTTDPPTPNLTVSWQTTGELNTLAEGGYYGELRATRGSDGKHRFMEFYFRVRRAMT